MTRCLTSAHHVHPTINAARECMGLEEYVETTPEAARQDSPDGRKTGFTYCTGTGYELVGTGYELGDQVAKNAKLRHDGFGGHVTKEQYEAMTQPPAKEFVTKDSGKREQFSTGMVRDTSEGKPRFDLVAPENMPYEKTMGYRHAQLMARGAKKYGDRNWELAKTDAEYKRFKQAAYRHFMQWYHGQTDEDHASAVYFNIAGAEYVLYRMEQEYISHRMDEDREKLNG